VKIEQELEKTISPTDENKNHAMEKKNQANIF
jgi:hypothetical protein